MLKRLGVAALLVLAACGRQPVRDEVIVQFHEDRGDVTVTAETKFDRGNGERVEAARTAALHGIDPWSVRLARLDPEWDEVTFARQQGVLERVTRRIRIPAHDLQRVFSDTSITVQLVRGDGWQELSFIPGSGSRATREQTRHFNETLRSWCEEVARYFAAIDHVYDYLDENPHRSRFVFAALLNEKDAAVLEEEVPLIEGAIEALQRIAERMDASEESASTLAEEADLIYNPFPARLVVRVPREKDLVIEPIDLFEAIAGLEGRWVSPDPLAALVKNESPTSEQLAALPRKSTSVINASHIEEAIREQLAEPRAYRIRWAD